MTTTDPWTAAMLRGDFSAAWGVSDSILRQRMARGENCARWPRHLQFLWKGEPLDARRVLVRCYHGLGDTIQFVRLLAPLRGRVREIVLWTQPPLIDLLRGVRGIDRLVPLHEGEPNEDYDVQIELMEVPHILRLTPDTIPARVPYIYVSAPVPPEASGLLQVGIAWRSGEWNEARSLPDAVVAELARVTGVQWHSLQYEAAYTPLPAKSMACREIHVMAERMQSLDLVISVDTMTAHLAGALGLPCWTLLHHDCDWRWMSSGDTSPWYPTMRLFRQPQPLAWPDVIAQVREALAEQVSLRAIRARDTRSIGCRVS